MECSIPSKDLPLPAFHKHYIMQKGTALAHSRPSSSFSLGNLYSSRYKAPSHIQALLNSHQKWMKTNRKFVWPQETVTTKGPMISLHTCKYNTKLSKFTQPLQIINGENSVLCGCPSKERNFREGLRAHDPPKQIAVTKTNNALVEGCGMGEDYRKGKLGMLAGLVINDNSYYTCESIKIVVVKHCGDSF